MCFFFFFFKSEMPFEFQGKASQLCLLLPIVSPFILYTLNLRCSGKWDIPHIIHLWRQTSVESSSRSCLGTIKATCLCIRCYGHVCVSSLGGKLLRTGAVSRRLLVLPASKLYLPHSNGCCCEDALPAPFPMGWSRSWWRGNATESEGVA